MSLKLCYGASMQVAMRELRNSTKGIVDALESGEEVTLTNHGRPVGRILPIEFDMADWLAAVRREAPKGDSTQFDELMADRHAEYAAPDIW
jgi:prevent-host-death family protein